MLDETDILLDERGRIEMPDEIDRRKAIIPR